MLVLSRKPGESVQVGPDVEVFVVEVKGSQVRLGFRCPRQVPIRRTELPPQVIHAVPREAVIEDPAYVGPGMWDGEI